ncbi:hypothetical protein SCAR479_14055 [Seiridium cardinale]|uniref:Uncharacterized protein n=1 Tax=Seiridium cardinale TaxID=138064 RepID=A0ABR2X665_9PEZI
MEKRRQAEAAAAIDTSQAAAEKLFEHVLNKERFNKPLEECAPGYKAAAVNDVTRDPKELVKELKAITLKEDILPG